jgi:hypothetical protein
MGQRVFTTPLIITKEDKKRTEEIRVAEERARRLRTPEFVRMGKGACGTAANADDFTDDTRRASGWEARARAAAHCRACPFSSECLPWAIETEQSGVFGGEWLRKGVVQEGRYSRAS